MQEGGCTQGKPRLDLRPTPGLDQVATGLRPDYDQAIPQNVAPFLNGLKVVLQRVNRKTPKSLCADCGLSWGYPRRAVVRDSGFSQN